MKKLTIALLLATVLVGCSPERRLQRLVKRYPNLLAKDTITIRDTFITKEVSKDTVFNLSNSRDTVVIKQDKLTIKHFYNRQTDSVYLQGKCAPDTFIKVIKVPYDKVVVKSNEWYNQWYWILIIISVGLWLIWKLCGFFYEVSNYDRDDSERSNSR
jgi:hypothetical protein